MSELEELRAKIDESDQKLFASYVERVALVEKIAEYKRKNNLPVENLSREEEVYEKLTKKFGEDFADDVRVLYYTVMTLSKTRQTKKICGGKCADALRVYDFKRFDFGKAAGAKVACQGAEGANSHAAAASVFSSPDITFYKSFEEVFRAVSEGAAEFGVLPIENSAAGSVYEIYDLLHKYELYIVKALKSKISHCLMAAKGVKLADVKRVISHPQALKQCSEFLKSLGAETREWANTALAAKQIAEEKSSDIAAICSKGNAEIYGLSVLAEDIQNEKENYTRFIVVSRENLLTDDADKISLSLSLEHKPYTLSRLLNLLASEGVNLQKIESRPLPQKHFEFLFYLDFDGNIMSQKIKNLMDTIGFYCSFVRFLGCYNE